MHAHLLVLLLLAHCLQAGPRQRRVALVQRDSQAAVLYPVARLLGVDGAVQLQHLQQRLRLLIQQYSQRVGAAGYAQIMICRVRWQSKHDVDAVAAVDHVHSSGRRCIVTHLGVFTHSMF